MTYAVTIEICHEDGQTKRYRVPYFSGGHQGPDWRVVLDEETMASMKAFGDLPDELAPQEHTPRLVERPPLIAELLVRMVTRPDRKEHIIGDLYEEFEKDLELRPDRAHYLYWANAFGSIRPSIWSALRRLYRIGVLLDILKRLLP
jgi:hypothetical protein